MIQHPHGDFSYIEFRCRCKLAHYCFIEEEQDGKPWYHDIKRYIECKEYPQGASGNDKRMLQRLETSFFLSGGIMMQAPLELVGLGSSSSMDSFASWKINFSGM